MNIRKGKRTNIVSLCTYTAVGNGINLKKTAYVHPNHHTSPRSSEVWCSHKVVAVGFKSLHQGLEVSARIEEGADGNELVKILCRSCCWNAADGMFWNLRLENPADCSAWYAGEFCFQLFIIAELLSKVIDIIPNKRHEPFWTQIHWKNPQPDDLLLYVLTVVFFKPSLKCIGWENINSRKPVHCAISEWNEKRHIIGKFSVENLTANEVAHCEQPKLYLRFLRVFVMTCTLCLATLLKCVSFTYALFFRAWMAYFGCNRLLWWTHRGFSSCSFCLPYNKPVQKLPFLNRLPWNAMF